MPALPTRSVRFKCLLIAVALVPCGLAMMTQFRLPVPRPLEIATGRPALVFHQYMQRPYVSEPQAVIDARFRFYNAGEQPVQIGTIERSCGCLGQQLSRDQVDPGESGEILLQIQTASESPGPKEFWAVVHYTDPHPRQVKLILNVEIPEQQVTVQPKALLFYQLGTDPVTQTVTVSDFRDQKLTVTNVECSLELIETGEIRRIRQRSMVQHELEVTIPGKVMAGQHRGVMTFHTDDAAFPRIVVPIFIQGPAEEASQQVQIDPGILRIANHFPEPQSLKLIVSREVLNPPLVVERADCSLPDVNVTVRPTVQSEARQSTMIQVEVPAGSDLEASRGILEISLEGRDGPLSIPVQVIDVDN